MSDEPSLDWARHGKIKQAAQAMSRGGVIAYPTEAVWGLGCDPSNERALLKLLHLKQRDPSKGLILVASSMEQLAPYLADLSTSQLQCLDQSWPGPYTWLVPDNGYVHSLVRGKFDTVALRVSAHPVVQGLCKAFGGPVVSTSCNSQGKPPALNQIKVRAYFGSRLDAITPGSIGGHSRTSEIRDLRTGALIR